VFSATLFTVMVPADAAQLESGRDAMIPVHFPRPAASYFSRLLVGRRPPSELVGDTVVYRTLLRTRRLSLTGAPRVRWRSSGTGVGMLRIRAADGGRAVLPILIVNRRVQHGLTADELDRLRDALAGTRDRATGVIRQGLRLQADHLRAGGDLADSPLRSFTGAFRPTATAPASASPSADR
jgi:hypothetical protein